MTPYGISKLAVEYYLHFYEQRYGLPFVALRLANVYGPRQDGSKESGAVSVFTTKLLAGEGVHINDDGTTVRDYVHVDDIVKAHLNAIDSLDGLAPSFNILNLGSSRGYSVLQLIDEMSKVSGQSIRYVIDKGNKFDLPFAVADNTAAKKQLGWYPSKSIRDICTDSLKYFH
jgi:UDP-glucose 4-epimerase